MSEESCNKPLHIKVELNANATIGTLLSNLQHLLDIFQLGNSSVINSNEKSYQEVNTFLEVSPASNYKLDFESAKSKFIIWNITNVFRDSLEFTSLFLEEVYSYCRVLSVRKKEKLTVDDWNNIWDKDKPSFHRLGLPDKIDYLKKNFKVFSDLDEFVISINRARNCLVHRQGIVSEKDLNNDVMEIKWYTFLLKSKSPDGKEEKILSKNDIAQKGWSLEAWFDKKSKMFQKGDKLIFSQLELSDTIMTLMQYGIYMHQSMLSYYSNIMKQ